MSYLSFPNHYFDKAVVTVPKDIRNFYFKKSLDDCFSNLNLIYIRKSKKKRFIHADLQSELISEPNSPNSYEYCTFEKSFVEDLDKHGPKKRKILRGTHKPKLIKHSILQL